MLAGKIIGMFVYWVDYFSYFANPLVAKFGKAIMVLQTNWF